MMICTISCLRLLESGEGAPDVVDIELGNFPAFTTGEIGLMDLTDAIEPYKDKVVESRLDLYGKDGKYYGFPTHVGTTVAFYNTEALEAAGIDYTAIKTWEDFKNAGVKYKELPERPLQQQKLQHSGP